LSENIQLEHFFASRAFAVVGASTNREKYGNKVLRCYMQHEKKVYPINPRAETIEGLKCFPSLADLPNNVESISLITPPKVTEQVVKEAVQFGIKNIWMQPGAESQKAITHAQENGINVLANGICILVVLGYRDLWEPA
jgi:predicted CoA-binding protein